MESTGLHPNARLSGCDSIAVIGVGEHSNTSARTPAVWFSTDEEIVRHWLQSRDNVLTAASVVLVTARARGN